MTSRSGKLIQLLIARHGNTFDKGDVVLRVGRGTDLPLSSSGREQAVYLGCYLKKKHPDISVIYTSTLKRTIETATIASAELNQSIEIIQTAIFDEIDYGPDEGKPESEVVARLGEGVLVAWDQDNVVPEGWNVKPEQLRQDWERFGREMEEKHPGEMVLVVTSNGNARFAPNHRVKLSTGALSMLTIEQGVWACDYLNRKPSVWMVAQDGSD